MVSLLLEVLEINMVGTAVCLKFPFISFLDCDVELPPIRHNLENETVHEPVEVDETHTVSVKIDSDGQDMSKGKNSFLILGIVFCLKNLFLSSR